MRRLSFQVDTCSQWVKWHFSHVPTVNSSNLPKISIWLPHASYSCIFCLKTCKHHRRIMSPSHSCVALKARQFFGWRPWLQMTQLKHLQQTCLPFFSSGENNCKPLCQPPCCVRWNSGHLKEWLIMAYIMILMQKWVQMFVAICLLCHLPKTGCVPTKQVSGFPGGDKGSCASGKATWVLTKIGCLLSCFHTFDCPWFYSKALLLTKQARNSESTWV